MCMHSILIIRRFRVTVKIRIDFTDTSPHLADSNLNEVTNVTQTSISSCQAIDNHEAASLPLSTQNHEAEVGVTLLLRLRLT